MAGRRFWWFLALWLFVSWGLYAQTITDNLSELERLLDSSIASIEHIERENETLKQTLENLETSLRTQSLLLKEQGALLNEQEANYARQQQIYETQKQYLQTLQRKSKIYKVSLMIAAPACIGFGAWLGWTAARR
jgi:ABC-type transporter Mla subunit MlaD